jgi:hypothetical protein
MSGHEQYEHDITVELRAARMEIERLKGLLAEAIDWIEECGEATGNTEPMLKRLREGAT